MEKVVGIEEYQKVRERERERDYLIRIDNCRFRIQTEKIE